MTRHGCEISLATYPWTPSCSSSSSGVRSRASTLARARIALSGSGQPMALSHLGWPIEPFSMAEHRCLARRKSGTPLPLSRCNSMPGLPCIADAGLLIGLRAVGYQHMPCASFVRQPAKCFVTSQDVRPEIERTQKCALHSCIENLENFRAFK
jgi:hypothetical protein